MKRRRQCGWSLGSRPSPAGFTLLELLVVIAIIGVVLALIPGYIVRDRSYAELEATARTVADGLRRARSEAIVQNREQTFTLDVENRRFRVGTGSPPIQLDRDLELRLLTARSEFVGSGIAAIRFFPDGGATGGRIDIAHDRYGVQITVDWLTGDIAIREGAADD